MNVIEVTNLVKRYGNHTAVDGVSFSVEEGEIFAILGPNGAGKTTTVESISGLRTPDSGTIRVLGLDPRRDRDELRRVVGVQLQESELPDQHPRLGGAGPLRLVLPEPARLGAAARRPRPRPTSARPQFGKLSGGQKQRLSIALALVGNPRIAILDELTTGPRPAGPPRHLAAHRGRPRPRRDGHPRHPLHGGGRAPRRPDRAHRRGPARRPRHAGRDRRHASMPSSGSASGRPPRSRTGS